MIGTTCKNLLAPENGDIDYILEENERDDITILQVCTSLIARKNICHKICRTFMFNYLITSRLANNWNSNVILDIV